MDTRVEREWITVNEYPALVIINHNPVVDEIIEKHGISLLESRWRCGYVGIPDNHPLYGLSYSDTHPLLNELIHDESEIEDRGVIPLLLHALRPGGSDLPIDVGINVHGSITFAGKHELVTNENHKELWYFGYDCHHCDDTIAKCTLDYCVQQCEYLASQLKEVERCYLQTLRSNASNADKRS